ncbi:Acetamidase formamidase [Rhizoctonia solani]|uniref:Acetamidase formamidase n=1 Tax=Rhizoctonia solani TaxID=456999 RepID=A0A8H7IBV2_9AGAM|nr:Acetamidase formamidase [Rhizoctonia solani]
MVFHCMCGELLLRDVLRQTQYSNSYFTRPIRPATQQQGLHNRWHPDIPSAGTVSPGQTFKLHCLDWTGGQIHNNDTADDIVAADLAQCHYLTGPVECEGAQPGDVLVVDVMDVAPFPDHAWGYCGIFDVNNGGGLLCDDFPVAAKAIWDLDGVYATSRHIPGVRFAGISHPGIMGCAPSKELLDKWNQREAQLIAEYPGAVPAVAYPPTRKSAYVGAASVLSDDIIETIAREGARTIPPREHGGNCDIKNLSKGSRVYFPVYVNGAKFSIGDLHFSQGDGELTFCGAIEMAGVVTLKFTIIKDGMKKLSMSSPIYLPSVVDPKYATQVTFQGVSVDNDGKQYSMDATVAYKQAARAAIEYIHGLGYTKEQAYLLMSCAPIEAHVASIVDHPNASITIGIPTEIFDRDIRPDAVVAAFESGTLKRDYGAGHATTTKRAYHPLPGARKPDLYLYRYSGMSGVGIELASAARQEELAESLGEVRQKVESACTNRAVEARETLPCLVAVSKYKPASDIRACYDLGQLDFGENYVDELLQKAAELPESIRWHFIGSLQSNKCKKIAGVSNLYCLHTLDSIKKADALQKALPSTRKEPLKVMIQVNTSGEDSKSGLQPLLPNNLDGSEASLQGDDDLGEAWGQDRSLALSMGMSADFEEAIRAGSDVLKSPEMRVLEALQAVESLSAPNESTQGASDGGHPVGNDTTSDSFKEADMIEEEENGDEDYDEGDEGEYDPDAEAEAMAQALGNQIWAELEQNIGDSAKSAGDIADAEQVHPGHEDALATNKGDSNPMIETIKTMLSLALSDPHVHYALMTTIVPGPVANGANLYTILSNSVMEGRVNPELAQPLSILISALASGSMMVSSEHQYAHTAPQDVGGTSPSLKRKRDPTDEGQTWPTNPPYNPSVQSLHTPQPTRSQASEELLARIQSATTSILQVLDPLLAVGQSLNQSVISSIQRPLHQVYSFVSTCPQQHEGPSGSGTLQEIGGLIQVIGILNEVPIAQSMEGQAASDAGASGSGRAAIGTAIYPCSTCPKAFGKLSLLRAHERTHSEGRPYRCEYAGCPASFARNHDLRRHEKSHERQMFRRVCGGCDRLFSRRDALRRHKANDKALDECREAPMDTSTVTHDGDPPRVTRVWQNHPESCDWSKESEFEEGEIQPEAIANARYIAGTLYQTLQRHVSKGLNTGGIPEQPENQSSGQQVSNRLPSDGPAPQTLAEGEQPGAVESPSQSTLAGSIEERTNPTEEPEGCNSPADDTTIVKAVSTLPGYGLDDEHTSLLEQAIAVAAQAAQAQAEAEAALYEEGYNEDDQDTEEWNEGDEGEQMPETGMANLVS